MPRCPSCLSDLYADLDLDALGNRQRYADYPGEPYSQTSEGQQQQMGQTWAGAQAGATGKMINVPEVNPNSYQYGGAPGGAAAFNQQLANANAGVQNESAAQIQNANAARDQGNVQGTLGGLSSFYQGQLNGTGPSLAAAQMKQATDQNIAAQQAAANSAHGSLAGVSAQMGAAQNAATAEQNAANQSMQGRIQEEYNAAQGMQGLGGLYEQEQGLNIGQAEEQAKLQEAQQELAARTGLGYAGLEGQTNAQQLEAQMAEQQQMSGNYLAASGMGMQQGMYDQTRQDNLIMGGIGAGLGLLAGGPGGAAAGAAAGDAAGNAADSSSSPDADFQEPSRIRRPGTPARSARGYADADTREPMPTRGLAHLVADTPAHLTLREERTVDGHPFMAIADRNTGIVEKVSTERLTPAEDRRVRGPHGAGPLFADGLARAHSTMHDMGLGDASIQSGLANLDWGASNDPSQGGTLLDQLRAQEAAKVAAAAPAGGYTTAQQQFYPGARTPNAQPSEADVFGPGATARAPTVGGLAGAAIPTGGYDKGWDTAIAARKSASARPPLSQQSNAVQRAIAGMRAGLDRMGSTQPTVPAGGYDPTYPYADVDLDAEEHSLAKLYADAHLGSGDRFAHLEHQLAGRGNVRSAGGLAAYIGREKYGAHKMGKLSAHGR